MYQYSRNGVIIYIIRLVALVSILQIYKLSTYNIIHTEVNKISFSFCRITLRTENYNQFCNFVMNAVQKTQIYNFLCVTVIIFLELLI